jgi:hypothetical protein
VILGKNSSQRAAIVRHLEAVGESDDLPELARVVADLEAKAAELRQELAAAA